MSTINQVMDAFFELITNIPDGMDEIKSFNFEKLDINVEYSTIENIDDLEEELDTLGSTEEEINETKIGLNDEGYVNKFEYTVSLAGYDEILYFTQIYAPGDRVEICSVYYDEDEIDNDTILNLFEIIIKNDMKPNIIKI